MKTHQSQSEPNIAQVYLHLVEVHHLIHQGITGQSASCIIQCWLTIHSITNVLFPCMHAGAMMFRLGYVFLLVEDFDQVHLPLVHLLDLWRWGLTTNLNQQQKTTIILFMFKHFHYSICFICFWAAILCSVCDVAVIYFPVWCQYEQLTMQ